MNIAKEIEFRNRVAGFILNWHTMRNPKALEIAIAEDFSRVILEVHITADEANKSLKQRGQSGRRAGPYQTVR